MTNEVSLVIRVNNGEAAALQSTVAEVRKANALLEADAASRLKSSEKSRAALVREAAATGELSNTTRAQILELNREISQREIAILTLQKSAQERMDEAQANVRSVELMRASNRQLMADEARRAEFQRLMHAQRVREAGAEVDAEIVKQRELNAIHARAIAEDIRLERIRSDAIAAERSRGFAKVAGATGLGGLVGGTAGAVLVGGAAAYFSSKTAIDFERAEQAIVAATGSLGAARKEMALNDVQAERLGVNVLGLQKSYSRFAAAAKGSNLEGEASRQVFLAVTEAGQKLSLSQEDVEGSLNAVQQMISKGKVQAEELRGQLGDRLPGAFNIFARALGVSTVELDKMLKSGEVLSEDALPKFAAELRRTFGTDENTRIETTISNFTRLGNEIKYAAAGLGEMLNMALSPTAGALAKLLREAREGTGAGGSIRGALFGANGAADARTAASVTAALASGAIGDYTQLGTVNPLAKTEPSYSPGTRLKQDITGLSLLQSGPNTATIAETKELNRLKREGLALDKEITEVSRVQERIDDGDLTGKAKLIQQQELENAAKKDANAAAKKAAAEGKIAAQEFKEQQKQYIDALVEQEKVEDRVFKEQQKQYIDELVKLEEVTRAREKAAAAAAQAAEEEFRRNQRYIRSNAGKRRGVGTTFGSINAGEADATEAENSLYASTAGNDRDAEQEEANYRAHQMRLTTIKEEAERQRHDLTSQYLGAGKQALGDAAEYAQAMGKKGFEAYKALSIAETVISTYESAQKAAESLYDVPYVGPVLAVAAAAAAIGAGTARVAAISAQNYGGGREGGGAVSGRTLYEVGERGKPETFEQNGRLYMIPGNSGTVKPAQALPGGGAARVTINNMHGGAEVSARQMSDGEIVVMVQKARADAAQQAVAAVHSQAGNPSSQFNARLRSANRGISARGVS